MDEAQRQVLQSGKLSPLHSLDAEFSTWTVQAAEEAMAQKLRLTPPASPSTAETVKQAREAASRYTPEHGNTASSLRYTPEYGNTGQFSLELSYTPAAILVRGERRRREQALGQISSSAASVCSPGLQTARQEEPNSRESSSEAWPRDQCARAVILPLG